MPRAEHDIAARAAWIELNSAPAAQAFKLAIIGVIESLDRYPRRGRVAPESRRWGITVRVRLFGDHRILYTIRGSTVVVLRMFHGAQDERALPAED